MSVADEIKARLDIVDYIQRYVPLKRAGKTWKAPCPFHSEKTPALTLAQTANRGAVSVRARPHGDVIGFAMRYHGWSFGEALQELGKLTGVEVERQTPNNARAASDWTCCAA